jgi:hypothetical protein
MKNYQIPKSKIKKHQWKVKKKIITMNNKNNKKTKKKFMTHLDH